MRANLIFIWLSIACALSCFSLPALALSDEKGWIIHQESISVGPVEIFLTKNAMKWRNPRSGLSFVATAPDWKVTVFNDSSRKFIQPTADELQETFRQRNKSSHRGTPDMLSMSQDGMIRSKTGVVCGQKAVLYIFPEHIYGEKRGHLAGNGQRYGDPTGKRREVWFATDIRIPIQVSRALTSDKIPKPVPFPLTRSFYTDKGKEVQEWVTTSVKATVLKPADFDRPKGFVKASNSVAFFMDDTISEFGAVLKDDPELSKKSPSKGPR